MRETSAANLPPPFRIGVRPLRDEAWLRVDETLAGRLAHKRAWLERDRAAIYRCAPGHRDAEHEALESVERWLARHVGSEAVAIARHPATADDPSPLCRAALQVAEDLVVLSRAESGWVLVAAFVACPSAWCLAEKIGRALGDVHATVPGFGPGSRSDTVVARMFDALRSEEPVVRGNWSLHATDRLYLPRHDPDHAARLSRTPFERLHFRHERQTLSKLPRSGDVLFTIDVSVTRVGELEPAARHALLTQIEAMEPGQRAYRSLSTLRR